MELIWLSIQIEPKLKRETVETLALLNKTQLKRFCEIENIQFLENGYESIYLFDNDRDKETFRCVGFLINK